MSFNDRFVDYFDTILKAFIGLGIILIAVSLAFLLGNVAYRLTGYVELEIATIGVAVLVFAYLSYKIYKNM